MHGTIWEHPRNVQFSEGTLQVKQTFLKKQERLTVGRRFSGLCFSQFQSILSFAAIADSLRNIQDLPREASQPWCPVSGLPINWEKHQKDSFSIRKSTLIKINEAFLQGVSGGYIQLKKKIILQDFPCGPVVKNPPSNAGDRGSTPGWGTKIPYATEKPSP